MIFSFRRLPGDDAPHRGVSLQDALVPTSGILSQIESNTRGGLGGGEGGGAQPCRAGSTLSWANMLAGLKNALIEAISKIIELP